MSTPVNFPDSPVNGEIFVNPNNGFSYQYITGSGWMQYTAAVSQPPLTGTPTGIYVGSEPQNPIAGIVWYPTGPGTFGIGYIWNGAEWQVINAGKVDSGLVADRPSAPTPGDLFFNTGTQLMEMWDAIDWVGIPTTVQASNVSFTSGTGLSSSNVKSALDEVDTKVNNLGTSLVYGGTYDASTNTVASVTLGGTDAGLTLGNPLPASAANTFVIVTIGGTGTAPAPTVALTAGNWLINGGSSWELLQLGDPTTTANLVTYTPTGDLSSTNVQDALTELDGDKANRTTNVFAGTGLTGGGDLTADRTLSLDNTGVISGTFGGQNKVVQIAVDAQGRITSAQQLDPQVATTFQPGVVQLDNSTTSTSELQSPTSLALKNTKDVADSALSQAIINDGDIGSLPNLQTGNQSDLVSAINEVDAIADAALPKAGGTMSGAIIATDIDVQTGFSLKFANGANGQVSAISDSIASTSQTTAASSAAAKTAYDKAVSAESDAAAADAKIGTLANLQTTDKTNTVSAINELDARVDVLSSSLSYGGTYDASTNTVASVTQAGTDAGLVVGQALVTGATTANVYVIILTAGTGTSPAPTTSLNVGDWLVGSGTSWDLLQLGTPSTTAGLVSFTPSGGISSTDVQDAIEELDLEKVAAVDVNITESNVLYVDAATGNDGTAVAGDITKPYATIAAAVTASISPNTIVVSEGTYAESNPINIPAGVQVVSKVGANGYTNTFVTPTVVSDDVFVLLGDGSAISGLSVETPTAVNKAAIRYTGGASTTASATFIGIRGTAAGVGDGIVVSSASSGKVISYEIRYQGLNMGDLMKVEGGILATESVHVPNTALGGGPNRVFSNTPTLGSPICRLQCIATNSGNSNVGYVAEIAGGTSVFYGVNWFNAANGIHLTSNDYDVEVGSGLIDCGSSVVVDTGLTGANGRLVISAFMNNSFSYPNTWSNSDFVFEFLTKENDPNVPSKAKVIRGADLTVGSTTKPNGATFGRGPIHKQQIVVLTSDNAASAGSDGNNITDVTAAVLSKDSSTFSFQGTAANHCIYFGTKELDSASAYVKHYGLDLEVLTGDSRDGKYVFEYWSGAAWVEIGSQSVSSAEGYSYSSDHFWRNASKEKIFYGIRPSTPISIKEIGGITAYWVRARVSIAPTALPQFEQCFLIPQSSLEINSEGIITKLGAAQTAVVASQGSNIFSENGSVANFIFTMGDGANAYSHNINNVLLNRVGEGLYWQTAIIQGVCTALPIYVELGYSLENTTATAPAEFDIYLQKIRASGTLVADSTGGLLPVQRPEAETTPFTGVGAENPTLLANQPLPYQDANKLHRVRFGPFSIDQFYEGDALALSLEVANLGTPTSDISIWGVAIIGYQWTDGIRGF